MKKILILMMAAAGLFLLNGCDKFDPFKKSTPPTTVTPTGNIPSYYMANISGMVVDSAGNVIANATLSCNGNSTMTDASGNFIYGSAIRVSSFGGIVEAKVISPTGGEMRGYAYVYALQDGDNVSTTIRLYAINNVAPDNSTGSPIYTIANNNTGYSCQISGLSCIKQDSTPYTGAINMMSMTLPVEYLKWNPAKDDRGNYVLLNNTYGAIDVNLTGASGEKLALAKGTKAKLKFSIPVQNLADAPTTLPLFHLNKSTMLWEQEGFATKVGNFYEAEVTHFSLWSYGQFAPNPVTVVFKFVDQLGYPLYMDWLWMREVGNSTWGSPSPLDNITGLKTVIVPGNVGLQIKIGSYCNMNTTIWQSLNAGQFAPGSSHSGVVTVKATVNQSTVVHFKGSAVDCSGQPLSLIQQTKMVMPPGTGGALAGAPWGTYMPHTPAGDSFKVSYRTCGLSSIKVAFKNNKAGYPYVYSDSVRGTFTPGVYDLGKMYYCSTPQYYIKYKIDGNAQHVVYEGLKAVNAPTGSTTHKLEIHGLHVPNTQMANILLKGNTVGTDSVYAAGFTWLNEDYNIHGNNITVNITSIGGVGQPVIGTFSGTIFNGAPHTISGSFKVLRQ